MNALISSPDRGGSLTAGGVLFGYRQCRHQPDHAFGRKRSSHQTGRGAALEKRGQPCSGTERCEAVEECLREKANADRDRTLEWSRFGPCAGPKSSKAMPPIKSRRTSVPIGAWPRQPAAWTSFGATGIRTRALLLRSPFPGNGISPSIRQGIKESVELWLGILKQSVSYDQVIDMRFVNEVRKRAERSTSGEISHRTGQAIEKLPATGCPTQL
jgi:hypothetical protein